MRLLSMFSGCGALDLSLERAGFTPYAFCVGKLYTLIPKDISKMRWKTKAIQNGEMGVCGKTELSPRGRERFWSYVLKRGPDDCWLYAGSLRNGYGSYSNEYAHRHAYRMEVGPIPEGKLIRHLCGNRRCVNPTHLEPGTYAENAADRTVLGEQRYGEEVSTAKISDVDAEYILKNPDGLKNVELATRFGVSDALVSLIRSGKRRRMASPPAPTPEPRA